MKKNLLFIVLATLCLNFSAHAQDKTALKIGDQVPDITINNILNYKDANGNPATTAKISDFKGKLLIIDFWATWCSPCVAMIPKMDSLQKEFTGKVQFLPVAYQGEAEIAPFLERLEKQSNRHSNLPEVFADKVLVKLFPHTYLPHYVWIDSNGIIKAISGFEDVTADNIKGLLKNERKQISEKHDVTQIPYDNHLPLLINNNGGKGQSLCYHSLLTQYVDGLPAGVTQYPLDSIRGLKITARNVPLLWIYRTAYGEKKDFFATNRIKLLVKDTSHITSGLSGGPYLQWLREGNGYCYELVVPPYLATQAYQIMQRDLAMLFSQYKAKIESQKKDCLVLIRTTKKDMIHSAGGNPAGGFDATGFHLQNLPLSSLILQLNVYYMQLSPYPVIDETGYTAKVDIHITANLSDVTSLNAALAKYELRFIRAKRQINVLTISDNPTKQISF
ncbi:Thiol-disulfide isomerase or thioredoxin [Mucilaginibacter pineti]|uniref:Thiol-disulfide isomerase or thioredoxin n=1 Tax=Mucilaginibacter pineti TaxID=1391627 RepID=A0A1G7P3V2_9SPHI|nr:TlpA disulfide reductase family protein [Mucilaginibacter pineti]SDF80975.1 Thiol-disulfide isomerase or thioredoxin [Mucilaginibacter pineti]